MDVSHSALIIVEGTNLEGISRQNIQFGFLLDLPFRLRVGTMHRFSFDIDGPIELWLQNRIGIPAGSDPLSIIQDLSRSGGYRSTFSQALIILISPRIEQEELEAIQEAVKHPEMRVGGLTRNAFQAVKSLNAFLVAYHSTTGQMFGGSHLHKLSDIDFFDNLRWEITIVCPERHHLVDEELPQIFNLKPEKDIRVSEQFTGELDDLPEEVFDRLDASLSHYADYLFYEVAFEAKSRMLERDFVGALLLSVVALEGAHAAFLRHCLMGKLPTDKAEALIVNLLRDAGLYNLCQVTPFLLMDDGERPTVEQLEACGRGITMRNEFMHTLVKKGQYKIRNRTLADISNAFSAVLKVYQLYVAAFEKRIEERRNLSVA